MQLLEDYIELMTGIYRTGTIIAETAVNKCIGFMECLYYQNKIHLDETETIKKYIYRKVSEAE